MQEAVGVIETLGFPAVLAAADAMVKAGRVTIVFFDKAERGNFIVVIRGRTSEVRPAMEAGLRAAEETVGGQVMSHYTVPNPPDNVVGILPLEYTQASLKFRS
ncbi:MULTISPECIES: carbon dioxide-concentrating mechanism protein CcmK [Cyanophyceae]|uniref:carbon dioxide-concentrating mechanism protein CcmK n=1 Tax=Cyanophyceae TaxID=3028117 RepID=UPI00016DCE4C|nr:MULTISPECIES: carbon dioxide-concentrating mechanism protein CcmK [Cyanophyceae]ACB00589.1 carbon dioxide concentrating mechanism protein [Picosynechococcus sp. PCC 7002]SMH50553.1 BMC domain-containing protein [Picosynechococcus sp. OG1]SMQ81866.1 BMC domain-containing protein [Synechococcus sp. 7002]